MKKSNFYSIKRINYFFRRKPTFYDRNRGKSTAVNSRISVVGSNLLNSFDFLAKLAQHFRTILFTVIIVLICFYLVKFVIQELEAEYIVIEPFEVPKSLEEKGLTGRVIANNLSDQLESIRAISEDSSALQFVPNARRPEFDIEVPGAAMSLHTLLNILRSILKKPLIKVTGEVYIIEEKIYVRSRVNGKYFVTSAQTLSHLDSTINSVSQEIVKYTQPYELFLYHNAVDTSCTKCIDILKYTISNKPEYDDAYAYYGWGWLLDKRGDYKGAVSKYQKAFTYNANDLRAHACINLGAVLYKLGDKEGALDNFKLSVQIDSTEADGYYNWGVVLNERGEMRPAIYKFQQALRLQPDLLDAYKNWGFAIEKLGKIDSAIILLRRELEVNPNSIDVYYNWGRIYATQMNYKGAIEKYREVIKLDPKYIDAYVGLSCALFESGDKKDALVQCRKALKLDPKNVYAKDLLKDLR